MVRVFSKHPFLKRFLFSLMVIIILLFGNHLDVLQIASSHLDISLSLSQTSNPDNVMGLFSLGLGPWMYASLLSQVMFIGRKGKRVSAKRQLITQNIMMLIIALIQGLGLVLNQNVDTASKNYPLFVIVMVTILISGAFVLSWLGSMNTGYGIGQMMIIILVTILAPQLKLLPLFVETFNGRYQPLLLLLIAWSLLGVFIMTLFERAEYRIPVQRISINNKFVKDTYLPIRVNLAGGMGMMYAFTFLSIPQYIIIFLRYLFPNGADWTTVESWFSIRTLPGVMVYALLLLTLNIAFAFFNMDVVEQAQKMRASGDFVPDIRPGRATADYLKQIIRKLSTFSGVIITILIVAPLVLVLGNETLISLSSLTGLLMMISGIFFTVKEEVASYRLAKQYKPVFQD